ncbi:hypothetical protein DFP73DRAFT_595415 [Morchella snyderi]|nr:hypothetical protein DFP73DRAFT_595415 [Morchella snyderi]
MQSHTRSNGGRPGSSSACDPAPPPPPGYGEYQSIGSPGSVFLSPDAGSIAARPPALVDGAPVGLGVFAPERQCAGLPTTADEEVLLPSGISCQPPSHESTEGYLGRAAGPARDPMPTISREQAIKPPPPPPPADKAPISSFTPKDDGPLIPAGGGEPPGPIPVGSASQHTTLRDKLAELIVTCGREVTDYLPAVVAQPSGPTRDPLEKLMAETRAKPSAHCPPREAAPREEEEGYRYRFARNAIVTAVRPQSGVRRGVDEDGGRDGPRAKRPRVDETAKHVNETNGAQGTAGMVPDIADLRRSLVTSESENQRSQIIDAIKLMVMLGPPKHESEEPTPTIEKTPVREKMRIREETPQLPDQGVENHQMFELPDPRTSLDTQEQYEILQVPKVQEEILQVPGAQEESRVSESQVWDPEEWKDDNWGRQAQQEEELQAHEVQIWDRRVCESSETKVEMEMGDLGALETRAREGGAPMYYFGGTEMELRGSQAEMLMQSQVPQAPAVIEEEPRVPEVQLCGPETQSYEGQELQVRSNIPQGYEIQEWDFQVPQVKAEGSPILEAEVGDLEADRYGCQGPEAQTKVLEEQEGEFQALEVGDEGPTAQPTNPETQRHGSEKSGVLKETSQVLKTQWGELQVSEFPDWNSEALIRFGSEEVLMKKETSQIPETREKRSQGGMFPVPRVDLEGRVPNGIQGPQQMLKEVPERPRALGGGLTSPTSDPQYDESEAQKMHKGQKPEVHGTMRQVPEAHACRSKTPRTESQRPHPQGLEAQEEEPPTSVVKSEGQEVHIELHQIPEARACDLGTLRYGGQGPYSQEHSMPVIRSEDQVVQRYKNQESHVPNGMSQALETQERMRLMLGAQEVSQLPEINEWHSVVKRHYLQKGYMLTFPGPGVVQVWHNELQRYERHDPQSSGRSQTPETQEEQALRSPEIPNRFPDRPGPLQVWGHQSQRSDSQQPQSSRETSRSQSPQGIEQRPQLLEAQLGEPEIQRYEYHLSKVQDKGLRIIKGSKIYRYEAQRPQTSRVVSQRREIQIQERTRQREESPQLPRTRDRHHRAEGPGEGEAGAISEAQAEQETNIPGIQEWYTPIEAEARRMSEAQQELDASILGIQEWYPPIEAEARRISKTLEVSEAREKVRRASEALEEALQELKARKEAGRVSEALEESQSPGIQDLHPEPRRHDGGQEPQAPRETPRAPEAQEGRLPVYRMHGAREVSKPQE